MLPSDLCRLQVCNTAAAAGCSPQVQGGPNGGAPATASLSGTFQVTWGIWVFSSGQLDYCDVAASGLQNWAFYGGQRSGAGPCWLLLGAPTCACDMTAGLGCREQWVPGERASLGATQQLSRELAHDMPMWCAGAVVQPVLTER